MSRPTLNHMPTSHLVDFARNILGLEVSASLAADRAALIESILSADYEEDPRR